MPTQLEYMQLATRVYATSNENTIGLPAGWSQIDWLPDQRSGFSAGVYRNGNEIVIAYAGTNELMDSLSYLAVAGLPVIQIFAAMSYYMAFKNAYPTANITFTGHSLGGGLASLMAVFFDKQAIVFDEMPTQLAALNPYVYATAQLSMTAAGYHDEQFDLYVRSLGTLALARESNVTQYYVNGEFLNTIRTSSNTLVGNNYFIPMGISNASIWERHSIALMTAMQASPSFLSAVQTLPDLVTQLLDKKLFAEDSMSRKEDLLFKLLRHQLGVSGSTEPDGMLTRFAADMQKIAQEGGLTMSNSNLTKALTAFAMQMYSMDPKGTANDMNKYLFDNTGVTGGIHFDRRDVAANLNAAKGYTQYFQKYLWNLPGNTNGVIAGQLSELIDWYIQAGTGGMTATAGTQRAFMLGGSGGDNLTGGTAADLLYGGSGSDILTGGHGADTLIGGAGNDVLNGGLGHDTYEYTIGDGNDQIVDEDKDGELIVFSNGSDPKKIALGNFYNNGTSEWKNINDDNIKIVGNTLTLSDGSTIEFSTELNSGDLGINLINVPDNPVATNTIAGDLKPIDFDPVEEGIQTQTNEWGNIRTDPGQPDPGRVDGLSDTTGNDQIIAGDGNDGIISSHGGNDWLLGGNGDDFVIVDHNQTNSGNDILEGNAGSDIVEGGKGNDKVFGDDYGEMSDIIAAGEIATGINERGDVVSTIGFTDQSVTTPYLLEPAKTCWSLAAEMMQSRDGYNVPIELQGADYIDGGAGNDLIWGT